MQLNNLSKHMVLVMHEHEFNFLKEGFYALLLNNIERKPEYKGYGATDIKRFVSSLVEQTQKLGLNKDLMRESSKDEVEQYYSPDYPEGIEIETSYEEIEAIYNMILSILNYLPEKVMSTYTGYTKQKILIFKNRLEEIANKVGIKFQK